MGEEGSVPPLPRRVPGATNGSWPATRPAPGVLPESVLQRVRAAMAANLEQATNEEQLASSEHPASPSQQVTDADDGPGPPAQVSRAVLPASWLEHTPDPQADTMPIPTISGSAGSDVESPPGDQASVDLDRAARAERAKALRAVKAKRAAEAEHAAEAERAKANRAAAERAGAERARAERAAEAPAGHRSAPVMRAPAERRPAQQADGRKALPRRAYRLARASVLVVVFFAVGLLALALFRQVTNTSAGPARGL